MKRFFYLYKDVILTGLSFALLLVPLISIADTSSSGGGNSSAGGSLNSSGGGGLNSSAGSYQMQNTSHTLDNPLGPQITSVCQLLLALVNAAMILGIPVAVLFIIWAGFQFVLAQGSDEALTKAKTNLYHVVIGIAIFLGSSLIASVIINTMKALGVAGLNSCGN